MNWKTWAPLILAIVFAVGAAKAVHDWMLKNKAAAVPAGKFTKVVVTKADVTAGKALTVEDLTLAQVEAETAPSTAFKTVEEVAGRVSETLMVKGQPVVEAMLAPTGSGSGLQALVPPGMRAITMEVNEFSGVAGMLTPGCRVDILATLNNGGDGEQLAKTIVQNVKVTAVGQRTSAGGAEQPPQQPGEGMAKSVTILCSLADAEAIDLACSTGRPRLVLRGGRDSTVVATAGVSMGELRGAPVAAATPPPATQPAPIAFAPATQPAPLPTLVRSEPAKRTIKVIRGGQESTVVMNLPNSAGAAAPEGAMTETQVEDPFDSE
ncbi:MAG TPA: Flp pilus assembly protein CpaB [Tepidisphaeraceae bacterium]|nr:Flp pilus assembly protein CpaB [Tepidisphaeraceae bacterium]